MTVTVTGMTMTGVTAARVTRSMTTIILIMIRVIWATLHAESMTFIEPLRSLVDKGNSWIVHLWCFTFNNHPRSER